MKERILLVEDEPSVREMYATRLGERYEIDTACNAEEGLITLRTIGPYAVVISDQHMPPGMGGLDFLAEVRRLSPDTVCLLLTSHANLEEAIAALNSGVVFRFLTKPCLGELLIRSIGASLAQYRMANLERRRVGELLASITSILVGIDLDLDPFCLTDTSIPMTGSVTVNRQNASDSEPI